MNVADMFQLEDRSADGTTDIFTVIEDESGDTFWSYGHVSQEVFVAELNRWLTHTGCGENCIDDGYLVQHLWAIPDYPDHEDRFTVAGITAETQGAFPVSRLML